MNFGVGEAISNVAKNFGNEIKGRIQNTGNALKENERLAAEAAPWIKEVRVNSNSSLNATPEEDAYWMAGQEFNSPNNPMDRERLTNIGRGLSNLVRPASKPVMPKPYETTMPRPSYLPNPTVMTPTRPTQGATNMVTPTL